MTSKTDAIKAITKPIGTFIQGVFETTSDPAYVTVIAENQATVLIARINEAGLMIIPTADAQFIRKHWYTHDRDWMKPSEEVQDRLIEALEEQAPDFSGVAKVHDTLMDIFGS